MKANPATHHVPHGGRRIAVSVVAVSHMQQRESDAADEPHGEPRGDLHGPTG